MSDAVLPCSPESAGRARQFVAAACAGASLPDDLCDSAQLATSELVTNAVVHGRSEVRLHVAVDAGRSRLRVEVGDDNTRRPQLQDADEGALDGRGLFIVDLLATRWGVREDGIGKVVWLEMVAAR